MLKFLIILVLIVYVFYKTAGFLLKMVSGNLHSDHGSFRKDRNSRKAPNSNLNIDNVPPRSMKDGGKFDGGEYVDFEELK